jgi:hypothetical protein
LNTFGIVGWQCDEPETRDCRCPVRQNNVPALNVEKPVRALIARVPWKSKVISRRLLSFNRTSHQLPTWMKRRYCTSAHSHSHPHQTLKHSTAPCIDVLPALSPTRQAAPPQTTTTAFLPYPSAFTTIPLNQLEKYGAFHAKKSTISSPIDPKQANTRTVTSSRTSTRRDDFCDAWIREGPAWEFGDDRSPRTCL